MEVCCYQATGAPSNALIQPRFEFKLGDTTASDHRDRVLQVRLRIILTHSPPSPGGRQLSLRSCHSAHNRLADLSTPSLRMIDNLSLRNTAFDFFAINKVTWRAPGSLRASTLILLGRLLRGPPPHPTPPLPMEIGI